LTSNAKRDRIELDKYIINYKYMPVKISKVKGDYKVSTPGGTKAKKTTKAKAIKQERLINAVEHGWKPKKKKTKKK